MPSVCPICTLSFKPSNLRQITCSKTCGKERIRRTYHPDTPLTSPSSPASETQTITDREWKINLPSTTISSLEELLAYCKVDLTLWKVKSFKVNKWDQGSQDASGVIRVVPLFQVYAILEPYKELIHVRAEIESLKADAAKWAPRPKHPSVSRRVESQCAGHLLEISIYDLHLAKLAWNHETGWSDWDTDLTTTAFNAAIETLVERSRPYHIDRILFPIGHDFFQVDNPSNTTTAGTSVDVDSRFKKTYRVGRQLLCRAIERLAEIAPVDVVMVSGNHDRFSNFTLGDSLECWFKNHPQVSIDNRPTRRKYYRYGRVLLGLTHGDDIKHADLFSLMPVEAPSEFASTTWREWHLGHLHKESLAEKHGIRTRVLPSLCSADEWHSAKGFVGNMRTATSFIWHPTECLVNQSYYHIPEARPGQAAIFDINK